MIYNNSMIIQEKYPKHYEHLGEMPVTLPDIENPGINIKNLRAYYYSLTSILENYAREHLAEGKK